MEVQRLRLFILWGVIALLGTTMAFAATDPTAPETLDSILTTTFSASNYVPLYVNATAGNITQLVITGIWQTKSWQGFYGNISGTITLDDVNNFTFYNWSDAEPRGQIYATLNTSISWINVTCFNFTDPTMNETVIESYYNISTDTRDGVPETFNETGHQLFQVGSRTMTACPTTYIFQNDLYQQENFQNVLLWDPTNVYTGWIYTTLIENKTAGQDGTDKPCYNNELCDFQILVNEDGHFTDTSPTPYYFWVEII